MIFSSTNERRKELLADFKKETSTELKSLGIMIADEESQSITRCSLGRE